MKRVIATTIFAATAAFGASAQYYGAGSTMNQPSAQYQRMVEQERARQAEAQRRSYENLMEMNRRARQQYIEAERQRNLQSNYYRKYPTESPTYRFVERAAPWVDRTSKCAFGIVGSIPPVLNVRQGVSACVTEVANVPQ